MSCVSCFKGKRCCVKDPNSTRCERCERLNLACDPRSPKKAGRPKSNIRTKNDPVVTAILSALKDVSTDQVKFSEGLDLMYTSLFLMGTYDNDVRLIYAAAQGALYTGASLKVDLQMRPFKVQRSFSPSLSPNGYVISIRQGKRTIFVGETFGKMFCTQSRAEEILDRKPGYVSLWSSLLLANKVDKLCHNFASKVVESLTNFNNDALTDAGYSGVVLLGGDGLMYNASFVERRFYSEDYSTVQISFMLVDWELVPVNRFAENMQLETVQNYLSTVKRKRES